jgi:hypothetical protein
MAIAAETAGTRVALVPVGLNFERKTAFRSRVTVIYGRAFSCADLLPEAAGSQPEAVRLLTGRISEQMRLLLVEADPKADRALVDRVDRLYAAARGGRPDPRERVARRRVIAAGIERLRVADPDRYETILLRLRRYDQRLARFGFRDRHLDWQISAAEAALFAARESLFAIPLLPLAAAALTMFAVPYRLTAYAARWFTREPDVAATAKVVAGTIIYAAWLALLAGAGWWIGGTRVALLVLALLPALAVGGLFAIERESAVLDAVRAWFLLRRTGAATRERLRRVRSDLADVLDQVNAWLEELPTP